MIKYITAGVAAITSVGLIAFLTRKRHKNVSEKIQSQQLLEACDAPLWEVEDMFTIPGTLMEYVLEAKESTKSQLQSIVICKVNKAMKDYFSRFSDEKFAERLEIAEKNEEYLVFCTGKNSDDKEETTMIRFLKAHKGFEENIQKVLDKGNAYVVPIAKDEDEVKNSEDDNWQQLSEACCAPLWEVEDVFTVQGALKEFALEAKEATNLQLQSVIISKVAPMIAYYKHKEELGGKEPTEIVGRVIDRLELAEKNQEYVVFCMGKNSEGKEVTTMIRFLKTHKGFEEQIQKALDEGNIFSCPIE